jgi:hypothetical protein
MLTAAHQKLPWLAVTLFGVTTVMAQTQVDLRNQSRNIDFTSSLSTKPIRTGPILPSTCSSGEAYLLTSAAPGQNLQLCVAGAWIQQGAPIAPTTQADSGPAVMRLDAVTLSIGGNCSIPNPCNARVGTAAYTYAGSSTITLTNGSPTLRIYISDGSDGVSAGIMKVRSSSASGVNCSGGCIVESSQTSFPGASIPLGLWTASTPGVWDVTGLDLRSTLATSPSPTAGNGILITSGASLSIAVDSTVVPRKFGGSGAPGNIPDSSLGDFYVDTTNSDTYQCFSAQSCAAAGPGNWVRIVAGSGAPAGTTGLTRLFSGPGTPAGVSGSQLGDFYIDTAADVTYQCFSAGPCTGAGNGNWVKVNSVSGGGTPATISGLYVSYSGGTWFPLFASAGLPDATAFTWRNRPGGATESIVGSHARHLTAAPPGTNGNNLAVRADNTVLSSASFTVRGTLTGCVVQLTSDTAGCFVGLTDGTKSITFGWQYLYGGLSLGVVHWSDFANSSGYALFRGMPMLQTAALKIVLTNGNLNFYVSGDGGASFDQLYSESATNAFSSTSGLSAMWGINNNCAGCMGSVTLTDWKVN